VWGEVRRWQQPQRCAGDDADGADGAEEGGGGGAGATTLLVGHSAINQALLGAALGLDEDMFRRLVWPNCGCAEVVWPATSPTATAWRWLHPAPALAPLSANGDDADVVARSFEAVAAAASSAAAPGAAAAPTIAGPWCTAADIMCDFYDDGNAGGAAQREALASGVAGL
jgi:hypothetical protein